MEDLDRVPTAKLPPEVTTVFFGCDGNANGYRLPSEAEFNYATPNFKRRPRPAVCMEAYDQKRVSPSARSVIRGRVNRRL